jgi:hypothetical protein
VLGLKAWWTSTVSPTLAWPMLAPPACLSPHGVPKLPPLHSHSGLSSGLNSWLMVTLCSLVTSEAMTVDLRRSSMCTDRHSPVKRRTKPTRVSSHLFWFLLISDEQRHTTVWVFNYTAARGMIGTPEHTRSHQVCYVHMGNTT